LQLTGASVRSGWLAALACRIFCCAPQRKRNALDGFAAGPSETEHMYQIDLDSFEAADASDIDPGVFDLDTGTVIVIDGGALSAVARALTWDRYDALLQAPAGDTSLLTEINREVGGPRFAIVSADAASPFSGDGAFRLKANRLVLLE
jgi:hypothetical protein